MNPNLIFQIVRLAVSLVEVHAGQDVRSGSTTEEMLLEIVRIGIRAYEQHTGEPLDPALIRAEAPL